MATISPQFSDPAGTPISYTAASGGGDQTVFNAEVVLHVKNANAGVNEVQSLTITGTPSGGFFKLTFTDPFTGVSQTTADIAYNANNAAIQAALEALTLISPGNVTVGGANPFTITFVNGRGGQSLPLITVSHTFTGGSSPNLNVTQTTDGAGQITVTVKSPTACDQGFFHDQIVVVSGAGDRIIGPFKTRFRQNDGNILWTYSSVTNIKVAAVIVHG